MNYKSKIYFKTIFSSILILFITIIYLYNNETISEEQSVKKNILVSITNLPDLALSTEAMYIRHRSLSDVFSLFKDSPSLLEYFPTSFVYNYSTNINNYPSKILHEK